MNRKIELLSPCGNFETLQAAVQNGADAIYMGGFKFGARSAASRNSHEELLKSIAYAHQREVKCYITVNTLIRNDELEECLDYLDFLQKAGADGVILQDMGLAYLAAKNFHHLEIHASTQGNCVNRLDAKFLKSMGFCRMVAARENTLAEIDAIKKSSGLDMEVFAHGALCVCYSGRCLFSFFQGGRSGNRGECAQSCRLLYTLEDKDKSTSTPPSYLLSPKDLRVLEHLSEFQSHGVDSIKIEGRLRRPEYVAVVTHAYRQVLDSLYAEIPIDIPSLVRETQQVFHRESTKGYVLGALGTALMNPSSPKSQGVLVGKVVQHNPRKKRLIIKLLDDLSKGDGLSTGEYVGRIIQGSAIKEHAKKGEVIEIDYVGSISAGTLIYKTHFKDLMERAYGSLSKEGRLFPLDMKFTLKLHEKATLWIQDDLGYCVTIQSDGIVGEKALQKPLQQEVVKKGLSKLGGTPFYMNTLECALDDISTISMASINALRKEAVELILKKRSRQALGDSPEVSSTKNICWDAPETQRNRRLWRQDDKELKKDSKEGQVFHPEIQWSVRCKTLKQLQALGDFPLGRIYVDQLSLYEEGRRLYGDEVMYFALPYVVRERELPALESILQKTKRQYLVNSFGLLEMLQDSNIVADYGLNLYNKYSWDLPKADLITPSLEILYSPHLTQLKDAWNKESLEIPVYLWPVLMVSEFCPHKDEKGKCREKTCANEKAFLVHQQGKRFPLGQDAFCRSVIYHYEPKSLAKEIPFLMDIGIRHFRLEFLRETPEEVKVQLNNFVTIWHDHISLKR